MKKSMLLIVISLVILSCKSSENATIKNRGVTSEKAMVVSAREEASIIGTTILQKGGNAFDAMVATELALAVAYPYAGNIGGGGFMVYRNKAGENGCFRLPRKSTIGSI